MTKEQRIQNYLGNISLEIAKIDSTICDNDNIPIDQLLKHKDRRERLQELFGYIKYLLVADKEQQQPKEETRILTMK